MSPSDPASASIRYSCVVDASPKFRLQAASLVWSPIDYNGGAADIIYSVSVIEHLATPVRHAWLRRATALLRPGGPLLLTVDLAAPGEELWPFAEGRVVEPDHGSFTDMCREAAAAGLTVDSVEIVRALPATRVDVALIAARRPGTAGGPS